MDEDLKIGLSLFYIFVKPWCLVVCFNRNNHDVIEHENVTKHIYIWLKDESYIDNKTVHEKRGVGKDPILYTIVHDNPRPNTSITVDIYSVHHRIINWLQSSISTYQSKIIVHLFYFNKRKRKVSLFKILDKTTCWCNI